jgi:hypothetical protein
MTHEKVTFYVDVPEPATYPGAFDYLTAYANPSPQIPGTRRYAFTVMIPVSKAEVVQVTEPVEVTDDD